MSYLQMFGLFIIKMLHVYVIHTYAWWFLHAALYCTEKLVSISSEAYMSVSHKPSFGC